MIRGDPSHIFRSTTHGLPECQKFAFFRDSICNSYPGIRPEPPKDAMFNAEVVAIAAEDFGFSRIVATGHFACRDRSLASRQPDDSIFVNFSECEDYEADSPDEAAIVGAGSARLFDNRTVFQVKFTRRPTMNLHSLRFAARHLDTPSSPAQMRAINRSLAGGLVGRLVSSQFRVLYEALRQQRYEVIEGVARSIIALLSVQARPEARCADGRCDNATLARFKDHAIAHLGDPSLSIATIALSFGWTTRTVQKYFAASGDTFSHWLMSERLELAKTLLLDPDKQGRNVQSVAYAAGFRDAVHFQHAFRTRFGIAPGAFRRRN